MWDHRRSPWAGAGSADDPAPDAAGADSSNDVRPETRAGWRPDMEGFHVRVRTYHGVDISFPMDSYSKVRDLKKRLEYYAGLWWTEMELHAVGTPTYGIRGGLPDNMPLALLGCGHPDRVRVFNFRLWRKKRWENQTWWGAAPGDGPDRWEADGVDTSAIEADPLLPWQETADPWQFPKASAPPQAKAGAPTQEDEVPKADSVA